MFMSPSMNISFCNMSKEFRISANNCKKNCILRSSVNYTYRYRLGFRKEQIYKGDFDFFRKNIFSAETDVIFYVTSNTSTFSVSVTPNYVVVFNIKFCLKNCSIEFCFSNTSHGCFRLFCCESYFFNFW